MSATNIEVKPRNFALRQAAERRAGKLIPRDVILEVTHRCNLQCFHCCFDNNNHVRPPVEMTSSEIADVLDQVFEAGVLGITFTGGEPLCRPDILEIMNHARERGLFFGLKTNGTLITESVADRLKDLGITGVHVSLYGATPATHEHVTGVKGSFEKTIRAVEILHRSKIGVGIRTTIMKCNFKEDKEIAALAERLGVSYHADPLVFPKFGQPGSSDNIRIDDEQLQQLVKQRNWLDVETGIFSDDPDHHLLCGGGRTRCAISPQGEVFPCALWRIPLGYLKQQSFGDIWHGEAANKVRSITVNDFLVCTKCELLSYCIRCPGLIHMENSGISGPSPESCRIARAVKGVKDDENQETVPQAQHRFGTDQSPAGLGLP